MRTQKIDINFNPNITHPFYFVRKGILSAIVENSCQLKGKLLDFGCGSKPYKSLFSHTEEYVGLDFQGEGHSHEGENVDVFYDGNTIPFPDNYFDSILCSEVFEHLFSLDQLLIEMNRVLKPGGKILITCPFVWNEHEAPIDFARYTQYALTFLLEKNNFKVLKKDKKGTFIETITQIRNLYMMGSIFGTYNQKYYIPRRFFNRFQKIAVTVNNLIGLILNHFLPKRYDIYLSNVFLVEKVVIN
jgi:SAM-dependent methyltransferase